MKYSKSEQHYFVTPPLWNEQHWCVSGHLHQFLDSWLKGPPLIHTETNTTIYETISTKLQDFSRSESFQTFIHLKSTEEAVSLFVSQFHQYFLQILQNRKKKFSKKSRNVSLENKPEVQFSPSKDKHPKIHFYQLPSSPITLRHFATEISNCSYLCIHFHQASLYLLPHRRIFIKFR